MEAEVRVAESLWRKALAGASISAVITGLVAALLSYPTSCDTTFAPFRFDCRNLVGWSAFADYPSTATAISVAAALLAGVTVFLMVRFSDS